MTYEEHVDKLETIADNLKNALENAINDNLVIVASITPVHQIGYEPEYINAISSIKLNDITHAVSKNTICKHREIIFQILDDLCAALNNAQKDHYIFNIERTGLGWDFYITQPTSNLYM